MTSFDRVLAVLGDDFLGNLTAQVVGGLAVAVIIAVFTPQGRATVRRLRRLGTSRTRGSAAAAALLIGRDTLLSDIVKAVDGGRSVLLWGPSGVGKSALLYAGARRLERAGGPTVIRLEASADDTAQALAQRLAVAALARLRNASGVNEAATSTEPVAIDLAAAALADGDAILVVDGLRDTAQAQILATLIRLAPRTQIMAAIQHAHPVSLDGLQPIAVAPLTLRDARGLYAQAQAELGGDIPFSAPLYASLRGNTLALRLSAGLAGRALDMKSGNSAETTEDDVPHALYDALLADRWRDISEVIAAIGALRIERLPLALLELLPGGREAERLLTPYGVGQRATGSFKLHASFVRWASGRTEATADRRAAILAQIVDTLPSHSLADLTHAGGIDPQAAADQDWAEALAAILGGLSDPQRAADLWSKLIQDNYEDPGGWIRQRGLAGQFGPAGPHLAKLLDSLGPSGAPGLKNLGVLQYWLGQDDEAARIYRLAMERYVEKGDEAGVISVNYLLGFLDDDRCLYGRARDEYQRGLERAYSVADAHPYLVATGTHLVGCAIYHRGEYEGALGYFDEAVRLARAGGFDDLLARARRREAAARIRLATPPHLDRAEIILDEADALVARLGRRRDGIRLLRHRAELNLALAAVAQPDQRAGRLADANRLAREAAHAFRESGFRRGEGYCQRVLGRCLLAAGHLSEARAAANASMHIAEQFGSLFGRGAAAELLGDIAEAQGDTVVAAQQRWRARNLYTVIGHAAAARLRTATAPLQNSLFEPPRQVRGVVFDMMETLAETDSKAYAQALGAAALRLAVSPEAFHAAWRSSRDVASRGRLRDTAERLTWVAVELGRPLHSSDADALAEAIDAVWVARSRLYGDALPTLAACRALGLRVAILSNGPPILGRLQALFGDAVEHFVVSSQIGAMKPEPESYAAALDRLALPATDVVFVGDGNDRELDGAAQAGLFPIKVVRPSAAYADPVGQSTTWDAEVASLSDLPPLLSRWARARAPSPLA